MPAGILMLYWVLGVESSVGVVLHFGCKDGAVVVAMYAQYLAVAFVHYLSRASPSHHFLGWQCSRIFRHPGRPPSEFGMLAYGQVCDFTI